MVLAMVHGESDGDGDGEGGDGVGGGDVAGDTTRVANAAQTR